MNLIKPKKLEKGDTISIIAPSGGVESDENLLRATAYLKSLGYNVKWGKNVLKTNKYLAGTDNERLEDLHNAFKDKGINAIIALRGGYGAIRLINKIDYNLIKQNPKIFAGYSDITGLSAMLLKHSGLITYSAPMINGDFGIKSKDKFTIDNFFKTVATTEKQEINAQTILKEGKASGITFGGNLATLVSLCGLDFIPNQKFIFFAEDLNEPVYKLDKMFTQLLNIEEFRKNISGIVFGEFLDIDNDEWLNSLQKEIVQELKVPAISGLKITHAREKLTIPIGIESAISNDCFIF
mgnify:FL=1